MTPRPLTVGPVSPARLVRADPVQRRARRRFYRLLGPTLVRVFWLHWTQRQDRQFHALGRRYDAPAVPLPETWTLWAAARVSRLIRQIPGLNRRPCYWRSQILYDLLPRFGFPMELHLGTLPSTQQGLAPHLWVSTRGRVLVDDPNDVSNYVELTQYRTEVGRA